MPRQIVGGIYATFSMTISFIELKYLYCDMLILLRLTKSVVAHAALLKDRAAMIRQEAHLNDITDIIPTYIKDRGWEGGIIQYYVLHMYFLQQPRVLFMALLEKPHEQFKSYYIPL